MRKMEKKSNKKSSFSVSKFKLALSDGIITYLPLTITKQI